MPRQQQSHLLIYILMTSSLVITACSSNDDPYAEDSDVAPYGEDGAYENRNASYTTRKPASSSPKPWNNTATTTTSTSYPTAKKVPGKKGRVYSPFAQHAGEVDVTGLNSGTQAKCPYTGNIFIVP
ncbi:MAG: hypothetical protein AAFY98_09785 [Verrucomicrobiota bacterium]